MYLEDSCLRVFLIDDQIKQYFMHQKLLVTTNNPKFVQFSLVNSHKKWNNNFSRLLFSHSKGTILKISLVRFSRCPQSVRKVAGKKSYSTLKN